MSPKVTDSATVELCVDGTTTSLPLITGTENDSAIDVRELRRQTGLVTYDPGLANTAICRSRVTYVDAPHGVLRYRGHAIEELARTKRALEVSHLLIHGVLPTAEESRTFEEKLRDHVGLDEEEHRLVQSLPKDASPISLLASCVAALGPRRTPMAQDTREVPMHRLLAKLPVLIAAIHGRRSGRSFPAPSQELDVSGNLLRMLVTSSDARDEAAARSMECFLILHADIGPDTCTGVLRLVARSGGGLWDGIAAAMHVLAGPLHRSESERVLEMLERVVQDGVGIDAFVSRAKDQRTPLPGLGHPIFETYDPRASILKHACREYIQASGVSTPLLEVAQRLDEIATTDEYFSTHQLSPNVDFYSGMLLHALGMARSKCTPLLALARLPGWIAHWLEQCHDPDAGPGDPRQVYVGPRA